MLLILVSLFHQPQSTLKPHKTCMSCLLATIQTKNTSLKKILGHSKPLFSIANMTSIFITFSDKSNVIAQGLHFHHMPAY